MPTWVISIVSFISKRSLHFIFYALLASLCFGIYQKVFPSSNTKIDKIERQVNVYGDDRNRAPILGCSAWRLNTDLYWKKNKPQ